VKITYFNKTEIEKRVRVRGVILGQKLTLNHPSLVDEGEKTRVLVTAHKRERGREKGEEEKYSSIIIIVIYIYFFLQLQLACAVILS